MPCESLGTHGGGWGKAKLDKLDKSGALQGGTVRVRASRSWARPAPRSEFFYWLGRAANRPAPVRRTAQEEPAAVGADAQLSETQSHPVRGSPSQSTSLHHRSQEFVVASLEKLPKTGRKPVFSLKFASKRQFLGKNEKIVPSHAFRGTGRSDGAPNMARGGASQPQPGWTPNSACI